MRARGNNNNDDKVALVHAHAHILADHVTRLIKKVASLAKDSKSPKKNRLSLSSIQGQPQPPNPARSSSLGRHT